MAKKLAFSLKFEGSDKLIQDLSNVENGLFSIGKQLSKAKKNIDIFNNGTTEQINALKKEGLTLQSVTLDYNRLKSEQLNLRKEQKALNRDIKDQGQIFEHAKKNIPTTSLVGLRLEYKHLRKEIDLLSEEARKLPENLKKISRADEVKKAIQERGREVSDYRDNVGGYYQALQKYFGDSDNKLKGLLGNIVKSKNGIGDLGVNLGKGGGFATVLVAGLTAVAKYTADVTIQFEKLRHEVSVTTGLYGDSLSEATAKTKAFADVYEQDFNESIRTANALSKQFGISYVESLDLIEKGLLAGADANNDFLDGINEYSTFFDKAGFSAEQFIVILTKFQKEGIYSDKGIDAVKEFTNRVTEQTKATKESLNDAFGSSFTKELFDNINNGSVSVADSLDIVIEKLDSNQLTAKQTQRVFADLFGGAGEDAGQRLIPALRDAKEELSALIDKTSAYVIRQQNLSEATNFLTSEQEALTRQLAGMGTGFDNLLVKAKGWGNYLLNHLVKESRIAYTEITTGLKRSGAEALLDTNDKLAEAQIKKAEDKLKEITRQRALQGLLSLADLRKEQAKLKKIIDNSPADSDAYKKAFTDYVIITKNVAEATKKFRENVSKVNGTIKEVAAKNSIESLTKKVSDLKTELGKSTPNKAVELIKELNSAKLDLSNQKRKLKELQDSFNFSNIESLSIEDRVKVEKELLNRKKELAVDYANSTISNELELKQRLLEINKNTQIELLKQDAKLKTNESDKLATLNKINEIQNSLNESSRQFELDNSKAQIESTKLLNERLLKENVKDTETLNFKLNELKLNSEIAFLSKRLELEKLSNNERLTLESDVLTKLDQLRQNKLNQSFENRNKNIGISENNALLNIVPTFDPNNVEASKQALQDYEASKTEIQNNAEIERLQAKKDLLIQQGADLSEINLLIADKELEIAQFKNAKLLEYTDERLQAQQELELTYINSVTDTFTIVAGLLPDLLNGTVEDTKKAQKKILGVIIDSVEKVTLATATAYSLASKDSVATFGVTGGIRAALMTGLIKAAFSGVKALVLEQGGYISPIENGVLQGKSHVRGGILLEAQGGEAVIKKESTTRWNGLLGAINYDGGGKLFGSDAGYWLRILDMLRKNKFEQGGVIGQQLPIPQLYLSQQSTKGVGISVDDLKKTVTILVEEQTKSLIPTINSISDRVLLGINDKNRLNERFVASELNGEI